MTRGSFVGRVVVAVALVAGLAAPSHGKALTYTFEDCDEGWEAIEYSSQATPTSNWHRSSPGADGSNMAFYNGPPYAGADSTTVLTSPVHKWKGGKITISFWAVYNYEPAATRSIDEGINVEWSSDGDTWVTVAFFGEMNPSFPDFDEEKVSFSAPKGPLQIRFMVPSDALVELTGGAVDNVTLPVPKPAAANC